MKMTIGCVLAIAGEAIVYCPQTHVSNILPVGIRHSLALKGVENMVFLKGEGERSSYCCDALHCSNSCTLLALYRNHCRLD